MAKAPPRLEISPPLINSANPWATTLDDLRRLYACPLVGAVTTRTSLINGFDHDPAKHRYIFFDAAQTGLARNASLNSLGYSPLPLETYLGFIRTLSDEQPARSGKGFIVSVTGSPEDIAQSYVLVASAAQGLQFPLAMEINLSCPNIRDKPPPAYSEEALSTYLCHLQQAIRDAGNNEIPCIPVGLKTPPFTHAPEYEALMSALEKAAPAAGGVCPLSFITATNTLGSCLVFAPPHSRPEVEDPLLASPGSFALPDSGLGGMAGAPLHPLALGNVCTIRRMLDAPARAATLGHVQVIGVGGVLDAKGYRRMRAVGADVVGVATGLGLKGVDIFGEIEAGLRGEW